MAAVRLIAAWRSVALLPVILLGVTLALLRGPSTPLPRQFATDSGEFVVVRGLPTVQEASPAPDVADQSAPAQLDPAPTAQPAVVAPAAPSAVMRLRIPTISVDAPVASMGLDAQGVMEVPYDPSTVAWYEFSAAPGAPGNAVMAGHVDWAGSTAVFYSLRLLQTGDTIHVVTAEGDLAYRVSRTYLVRADEADIADIVGVRAGAETLTLITCGGTWDRSAKQYDRRVIVRASRI